MKKISIGITLLFLLSGCSASLLATGNTPGSETSHGESESPFPNLSPVGEHFYDRYLLWEENRRFDIRVDAQTGCKYTTSIVHGGYMMAPYIVPNGDGGGKFDCSPKNIQEAIRKLRETQKK